MYNPDVPRRSVSLESQCRRWRLIYPLCFLLRVCVCGDEECELSQGQKNNKYHPLLVFAVSPRVTFARLFRLWLHVPSVSQLLGSAARKKTDENDCTRGLHVPGPFQHKESWTASCGAWSHWKAHWPWSPNYRGICFRVFNCIMPLCIHFVICFYPWYNI